MALLPDSYRTLEDYDANNPNSVLKAWKDVEADRVRKSLAKISTSFEVVDDTETI